MGGREQQPPTTPPQPPPKVSAKVPPGGHSTRRKTTSLASTSQPMSSPRVVTPDSITHYGLQSITFGPAPDAVGDQRRERLDAGDEAVRVLLRHELLDSRDPDLEPHRQVNSRPGTAEGGRAWNFLCNVGHLRPADVEDDASLAAAASQVTSSASDFYVEGLHYTAQPGSGNVPVIVELSLDVSPRSKLQRQPVRRRPRPRLEQMPAAPHPRMHGITHVAGGPDPVPGSAAAARGHVGLEDPGCRPGRVLEAQRDNRPGRSRLVRERPRPDRHHTVSAADVWGSSAGPPGTTDRPLGRQHDPCLVERRQPSQASTPTTSPPVSG